MSKLCIPKEVLNQHCVVLGKTGKGKSSVYRYLVEYLLRQGKRVCVVDPKGDWWGLKSSADGKGAGFPVILFGSFKQGGIADVVINGKSGREIAELVATGNRPCVIGMSGWHQGEMSQFWIEFASKLFSSNSGELYLVCDEFHNFAPKGKIMSPQAGECLHWSNRILSEGRGLGLVCLIASQRPQKVHNDSLTCCETLFAMGVNHPADRAAVKDWIDGCGDREKGTLVLDSLAGLKRGQVYVWSPEINYGPELVEFPKFETFDSFAPPQLQPKVAKQGWAEVNLEAVKEKLAMVIEENKANDPAELKRSLRAANDEIAKLRKQVEAKVVPAPAKTEIKEVPVFAEADITIIAALAETLMMVEDACKKSIEEAHKVFRRIDDLCAKVPSKYERPRLAMKPHNGGHRPPLQMPKRIPARHLANDDVGADAAASGELTGTQQKILDTVSMLRSRGLTPNRDMIARWLSIHPNGGRYGSDLARLRADGYLDGCELTDRGEKSARGIDVGFTPLCSVLEGTQVNILEVLRNGEEFTRDTLAEKLGIHPNGGRYGSDLARLRTMGIIPERGTIKLTEAAFV